MAIEGRKHLFAARVFPKEPHDTGLQDLQVLQVAHSALVISKSAQLPFTESSEVGGQRLDHVAKFFKGNSSAMDRLGVIRANFLKATGRCDECVCNSGKYIGRKQFSFYRIIRPARKFLAQVQHPLLHLSTLESLNFPSNRFDQVALALLKPIADESQERKFFGFLFDKNPLDLRVAQFAQEFQLALQFLARFSSLFP